MSEFVKVGDKCASWKTMKVKSRLLPPINSDLINLLKLKEAWAKERTTRDPADWEEYKHLRNFCKTKTRNAEETNSFVSPYLILYVSNSTTSESFSFRHV